MRGLWAGGLGVLVIAGAILFAGPKDKEAPEHKGFDTKKRVPWTTSRVVGSPEPPPPYRLERAFPDLSFSEPLELSAVPEMDRWVVAERKGKIYTFANDPKKAEKKLLIDLKKTVYGVVMHPRFSSNGYFYVTYVLDPAKEQPEGSRLSRFKVKKGDALEADLSSEEVLLSWPSGGHNGGCIRFGPDGYLYLATGDGSGIADSLETGQDLSDLLGSILRIDVNGTDGKNAYHVPGDNPFVKTKGARPEIWAYGLRQIWKFSFDPKGTLWAGEVGQDLWEMILQVEKGGNYGWSVQEGAHPFRPQRKKGPSPILPPLAEHHHTEFRSITGGYVYDGKRLPKLKYAYIYGDFDTGRVWLLRHDGTKVTERSELAKSRIRIVAWGQDRHGEIYALDFIDGGLHQLTPIPAPTTEAPKFPRKLSETGLFTSTKDMTPAPGLMPYSVNAELWSDGAVKERYLAIPGEGKIEYNSMTYPQPAPGSQPGWRFPDGTVLVKSFFLDLEPGNPKSRKRLETRLLHVARYPGSEEVGDQVWNGYTYLWNDEQTDAELIEAKGLDKKYTIKDPKAPGGEREQVWHFPSRAECNMCHTVTAKYALGVNTAQMHKDHDYGGGVVANQLTTLEQLGYFTKALPEKPIPRSPKIVDHRDKAESLDLRARSYLHANCSHCHRKWGGGNAEFQLLATLPLGETGTVDVRPAHGTLDLKDPRLLVPGDAERSLIYQRMTRRGLGQMPHIASNVVDTEAAELIKAWIEKMPK